MLKLLGFINKTGKLLSGSDIVIDGVRRQKVCLVICANDASENTKKVISDKTTYYQVPLIFAYSSEELSLAIGKKNRMIIGITDSGFAKKILEMRDIDGKK